MGRLSLCVFCVGGVLYRPPRVAALGGFVYAIHTQYVQIVHILDNRNMEKFGE